ncbi:MAG: BTAD domain-containing putative transcriptional regulator, partial [Acidobacteriota bacterium]
PAGPPPEPWLRELLLSTEGWAGPASWLLSRYASEPLAVGELIEGEAFQRWFEAKVLDPIDEGVLDALETLADAEGDWHLDLWRDLWAEEPHRLAALEQGVSRWGLILDPGGSPKLPALLRRFLLERAGRRDPALRTARRPALEGARRDGRGGGRPGPVGASRTGSAGSTAVGGLSGPSDGGFELRLLGHPAVRSSGATVDVEWPLRRALLTVAFLALSPDHRASRDEIVHGVWPESDPEAIRRNFHPTLSHARRVLTAARPECGDPLPFRQGLYGLAPGLRWWVDAVEVETRARAGIEAAAAGDPERAVDLLAGAWRLFRGPLLEGFDLEWIEQRRGALRRLHLDLLRNLGAAAVTVGRDPLALDAYRALLFEEPFEETAHVAVMELYARGGRRDLLRRQFLRLQDLLAELNVEPARETQERYHDLMG